MIFLSHPALYNPEEGLMAFGGDLSVERIWFAYQLGIFPWFNEGEEILWWCPDPRFVLFPNEIKISKSMRKVFRDETFSFTENQCFIEVIRNCKDIYREDQDGTWITDEMEEAYIELHRLGKAKVLRYGRVKSWLVVCMGLTWEMFSVERVCLRK